MTYAILSHDNHYYALADPKGVRWVTNRSAALQFQLRQSAQCVIDTCRYNAKVIEL